jgi:DNA invertase Pin-like site-specific DNA recombinase
MKLGYIRVSTEKQDPASQRALLVGMGIADECIYIDEGISGWTDPLVRPTYKRMMKRIEDPTLEKVDTIIFSEFSRLGRNAMDGLTELTRIEKMGITVKSLSSTEAFLNDVPSPWQGYILHGMMLGAELERKHHKERTQWAMDNIKATGNTKTKRMPGRPCVEVDWNKIEETKQKYGVKDNMAAKICGYTPSTFYKAKKERKEQT